ncbi:MAG: peptide chain release factor N(5)-glutamine methyltransferase [Coriobacteriia bacterium]
MSAGGRVWTVKQALDWTRGYLTDKSDEHPRQSAEWLLSAATGLSRVEVYAYHDRPLTPEERVSLREAVKRRAAGEPLQYVTGEVAFRHIVLRVVPGVFIPRPETEILAEECLTFLHASGAPASAVVVDACTGSGAVACSIAQEQPGATVHATELSLLAVATARANAERLGLADRVTILEGDLLSPLPDSLLGNVDCLVSNPPYIPSADLPDLPAEVLGFEPHLALDGGVDGLDVARRLMNEGRRWLKPGGMLAMELDEGCVDSAVKLMEAWYEGTRTVRDLAGRDRIATGYLR